MKIVFLARYLPAEGSTTHMYSIADGLIDRGHEVYIFSAGPEKEPNAIKLFEISKSKGVKFVKVPFPLHINNSLSGKISQVLHYVLAIPSVLKKLFKIKPDVIHAHYPVTTYLTSLYRMFTGKKYVVTHHIMGIPKHPFNRKADYVIAISRELEDYLITHYNYSESEVKLIFNGVSEQKFSLEKDAKMLGKKEFDLPSDHLIFGFVGSVSKRKGIDVLIEAFALCKHLKIHLLILGDGSIDWAQKMIDENNIAQMVTLLPFRDPKEIYNIMHVLILPSRIEGFPLVPIEAMMMKKPVIRSNVEGSKDQIIEGFNGYIFESENHRQLANIIEKIALKPDSLIELAKNAQKHALENFTEELMIDKLLDVYSLTW